MNRYLRFILLLVLAATGLLPCRADDHIDSLLQEMLHFISPDSKLTRQERRAIEQRIQGFPQKIIRRDTTTLFLHTAYAIGYYEFSRHDYRKALQWVENFKEKTSTKKINDLFRYQSVNLNASSSLNQKGKIKIKKDKNSWVKFSLFENKFDYRRTPLEFMISFVNDIPTNWNINKYRLLLNYIHMNGGKLTDFSVFFGFNVIHRMKTHNRGDVVDLINDIWNAPSSDYTINESGNRIILYNSQKTDSGTTDSLKLKSYFFNPEKARLHIDSLILVQEYEQVSQYIPSLIDLDFKLFKWKDLIKDVQEYEHYVTNYQHTTELHNCYALALLYIGQFNEALKHFDKALSVAEIPSNIKSTIRLNKAYTLGISGHTEEALSIFMEEYKNQKTPLNLFCWHDNLGYILSQTNPKIAMYHYNTAEKYLDSPSSYSERKVRHFCRKARELKHDRYLQRLAIEEALQLAENPINMFTNNRAKGMAYTEMGTFCSETFNYEEADRYFSKAREAFDDLDPEDTLFEYLDFHEGINLRNLGDYEESWNMLWSLLMRLEKKYGDEYKDIYRIAGEIIHFAALEVIPDYDFKPLYDVYLSKRASAKDIPGFEDVMVEIAYHYWAKEWDKVTDLISQAIRYEMSPIDKIMLWAYYDDLSRRNYFNKSYADRLMYMLPVIREELPKSLLTLSGDERRSLQKPLMQITDGMIETWADLQALDLVLLRKGLLLSTRQTVEHRLAEDKKSKKEYTELIEARKRLNDAISFNDTTHIPSLKADVWKKETILYHSLSHDEKILKGIIKTTADVQKNLKHYYDTALEFSQYQQDGIERYGVFVIRKYGLTAFVDLGTEKELMKNPASIWLKLDEYIKNAHSIYFCPDGILNGIGLEYLPLPDGRTICDVLPVHRVFHLAEISEPQSIGDDILLIGVADHNSPIGQAEPLERGSMTDLYNVDYEINLIRQAASDRKVRYLFNDEATESAVKSISGSPVTTLHISTHGFYRDEEALKEAAADPDNYDYHMARRALSSGKRNMCGLVLRDGNISWKSPVIMEENDGLLTSDEIETMNFPDLKLTVLSACETGLGPTDAEGVWGLQRAFRTAGTKNLLCTLSKVNDYYTAQFMDIFYQEAAKGATVFDAFHKARRWLYNEQPDHPELWSAFILIE